MNKQVAMKSFLSIPLLLAAAIIPANSAANVVLGKMSIRALADPEMRLVMGDFAADSYSSQGWDATMFLENTSLTEFTNPSVEWTNLEGYLSRGLIGNFGPAHINPVLGYPAGTLVLISWDAYANTLPRGWTYVSRPVDFWFKSDQSAPAYIRVDETYGSVNIVAVPEPKALSLVGIALIIGACFTARREPIPANRWRRNSETLPPV
jgi:hypothetical protein